MSIDNEKVINLNDHIHASSHHSLKKKMKTRRSMDIEFHDHLDDSLLGELEQLDFDGSDHDRISRNLDPYLDDDSFGEASDSCEPDHEFLDQILEECHPERLNLLERSVPEAVYNKKVRSRSPTVVPRRGLQRTEMTEKSRRLGDSTSIAVDKPSAAANDIGASNNTSARSKSDLSVGKATEDSESNTEEECEDAFTKSPQKKAPELGLDRTKLLSSMGKSTKKSLRTINGTFWSKPFKGLAQSMRRNGNAQGVADS